MNTGERVVCVVVSFNPDHEHFARCIKSISENKVRIIVVDNGSENASEVKTLVGFYGALLVAQQQNVGIAKAQNIGIEKARDYGAEYIWLSDQDTVYPDDYVNRMFSSLFLAENKSIGSIAAIGPAYRDTNRGELQPLVRSSPFPQKFRPKAGLNRVSQLIASGMIVRTRVFDLVGLHDERLFIDWVDLEWCLRAKNIHNLELVACGDVTIDHTLGDHVVKFLGRRVIIRSPIRHYFFVRNALFLGLYSSSLNRFEKFDTILKGLIWAFLYPVIAPKRKLMHFKETMRGLLDGFLKRL